MNTDNQLLNAATAAQWCALSVSTLAKMRLSGRGPAYVKLGRRVAYRPEDLSAWISEHRHRSTSEYDTKTC